MKTIHYLFLFALLVTGAACTNNNKPTNEPVKQQHYQQSDFADVLQIQAVPSSPYKLDAFGFSDQGAWHAFGLPPQDSTQYYGAFTGPLLMRMWGTWSGPALFQLQLQENGTTISLANAKAEMHYLPGKLQQNLMWKDLLVQMELIFADNRSSLVRTRILNKGKEDKKIRIGWKGAFFKTGLQLEPTDKALLFSETKHKNKLRFVVEKESTTNVSDTTYSMWEKQERVVPANQMVDCYVTHSHYFEGEQEPPAIKTNQQAFVQNKQRWEKYLNKALESDNSMMQDSVYRRTAVKSVVTLLGNWRSPAGDLQHDGVFPSAAYQGFYGFWSWDSWKHAVALVNFHPELAKNSMRSMFDFQNEAGMIADCVYFDDKENNWRDTKAPLASWAVWEIYKATKDSTFLREMLPALEKYHSWWYAQRDVNKNGLCEYGSTDGSSIAARWESGMDNAVRFDSIQMLETQTDAFSMNVESVDLNAYLAEEKKYLSYICEVLLYPAKSSQYKNESNALTKRVQEHFFSTKTGFFHDYNISSKQHILAMGPEGWIPLWTETATINQAALVEKKLSNPMNFSSFVPFPTLDASHPKFNPTKGYWRGPVWLDQAYFGIRGLEKYGFKDQATKLKKQLFVNAEGILTDAPLRENYHPLTGKGLNAEHFSWSAAHVYLLLTE